VSKNYLTADELAQLNRLTTMFLDFAEDRASRRQATLMADWIAQTDRFLTFNERAVLSGPGRISREQMEVIAHERFAIFDEARRREEAARAEAEDIEEIGRIARQARGRRRKDDP
jgi:hypothetical protein